MYHRTLPLFLVLVFSLCAFTSHAQANKKLEKAVERFKNGEMEEGIADARKLLTGKDDGELWDVLVQMYMYRYMDASDPSERIAKEVVQNITKTNSMSVEVREKEQCLQDMINACREATYAGTYATPNRTLRAYLVDTQPDSARSEKAKESMAKAEKAFSKKDYAGAMRAYRETLVESPNDYQATLYIGDCHFYLDRADSAAIYFRRASVMQPGLMEPHKYLVDALGRTDDYDEAQAECIISFSVYPDESMFMKLEDVCERRGRKLDRHWIRRGTEANMMDRDQEAGKGIWKRYRDAKAEIAPFCNADGVVDKPGAPNNARYMEVFAWERMLSGSGSVPEEFKFAKQMMDAGYLDHYVFLCVFHHDFHAQYRHFADANKQRFSDFFTAHLIH